MPDEPRNSEENSPEGAPTGATLSDAKPDADKSSLSEAESPKPSFSLSLLRLMRIPNVFTAIADVMMGFIFIHQSFEPVGGLVLLILATACLYSAGMILNDVFDFKVDSELRPERPIPSGAISLRTASLWGTGLLTAGFLLASASFAFNDLDSVWIGFEPSIVAACLIVAILLYNKVLKKTPLAPLAMGSCRFLNILLGMSLVTTGEVNLLPAGAIVAGGVGLFIAGVTWFARTEAQAESNQKLLTFGFVVMVLGLGTIMSTPFWKLDLPMTVNPQNPSLLPIMIGFIGLSIGRLALMAIADPIPQNVQMTIKQCILSLILINAALCLWIQPYQVFFAFSVVVLIFPTILLGRMFRST